MVKLTTKKKKEVVEVEAEVKETTKKKNVEVAAMPKVAESAIKKKRPWRDKIRKKAAKIAARERREEEEKLRGPPVEAADGEGGKRKKKKKKRKKKNLDSKDKQDGEESEGEKMEEGETGEKTGKKKKTEKGKNKIIDKEEAKKKLKSGRFRFLNEQLYTMKGAEAYEMFKENPDAFRAYHDGFAEQCRKWPNHPLRVLSSSLKAMPAGKKVLDLGCGEANLAKAIGDKQEMLSFDLVAVNERVTACDMAHLPVEDESADVVVFCLSLMGTNLADYLKEANRVLKTGGSLKIAEVTSRFTSTKQFITAVCQLGFECSEKKDLTDYFTMMEFQKTGKIKNKRPLGLKLKPCLYKKR